MQDRTSISTSPTNMNEASEKPSLVLNIDENYYPSSQFDDYEVVEFTAEDETHTASTSSEMQRKESSAFEGNDGTRERVSSPAIFAQLARPSYESPRPQDKPFTVFRPILDPELAQTPAASVVQAPPRVIDVVYPAPIAVQSFSLFKCCTTRNKTLEPQMEGEKNQNSQLNRIKRTFSCFTR